MRTIEEIYKAEHNHEKLTADEKLALAVDEVVCMNVENVVFDDYSTDDDIPTTLQDYIDICYDEIINAHQNDNTIVSCNHANRFNGKSKLLEFITSAVKKEIAMLSKEGYKFSNINASELQ